MVDETSSTQVDPQEEVIDDVPTGGDQPTPQQGEQTAPPAEKVEPKEPAPAGEQAVAPKTDASGEVSSPGFSKRISEMSKERRQMMAEMREQKAVIDELRGSVHTLQSGIGNQQSQGLQTEEQITQQQQLVRAKQLLGIDKFEGLAEELKTLKAHNQEQSNINLQRQLNDDAASMRKTIRGRGLASDEDGENDVLEKVEEFMRNDDFFSQFLHEGGSVISPHSAPRALDVMLAAGTFGDLGKLAASQEMIAKQQEAIKGKSERGTQLGSSATKTHPDRPINMLAMDLMNAQGGVEM